MDNLGPTLLRGFGWMMVCGVVSNVADQPYWLVVFAFNLGALAALGELLLTRAEPEDGRR